jgi:hypothetical protein
MIRCYCRRSNVLKSISFKLSNRQEYGEESKKWDAKVIKVGVEKKEDEIRPDRKQ